MSMEDDAQPVMSLRRLPEPVANAVGDLVQSIAHLLNAINWPVATMFVVTGFLLFAAFRVQKNDDTRTNFIHLILDEETARISLTKFGTLVALVVSSWGLIALVVGGVLTEWYFATYMLAWAGNSVLTEYLKTKTPAPPETNSLPPADYPRYDRRTGVPTEGAPQRRADDLTRRQPVVDDGDTVSARSGTIGVGP